MASTTIPPDKFLFYDTETSGLDHTAHIGQYGAIMTDTDFNEIERVERLCLQRSDVIPAVPAYLTHKIKLSRMMDEGKFEPEFFEDIKSDMMKDRNTCVVGYNSMKFDDERVRESFFRTNKDPYEREWKNGNSRFDVFKMVKAVYALKRDAIEWPTKEDGSLSMQLEKIAPLNGIKQTRAHDAMSDVEATIGVMKLVKDKEPQFFDYCLKLRNKAFVGNIVDKKCFLMVGESLSKDREYSAIMMPLVDHPQNKNSKICLDVARCTDDMINEMISTDPSEIRDRVYRGEKSERFPLAEVKMNQLPFVFTPALLKNDLELQKRLDIDYESDTKRVQELGNDQRIADLMRVVGEAYNTKPPAKEDVYGQIYNGFIDRTDRSKIDSMSINNYSAWEKIANSVSDSRISPLTIRMVGNINTEFLSDDGKEEFENWMKERYNDETGKYGMTLVEFWYDVENARKNEELTSEDMEIIKELDDHVQYFANNYAPEMVNNKEMKVAEFREKKEQERLEYEERMKELEASKDLKSPEPLEDESEKKTKIKKKKEKGNDLNI